MRTARPRLPAAAARASFSLAPRTRHAWRSCPFLAGDTALVLTAIRPLPARDIELPYPDEYDLERVIDDFVRPRAEALKQKRRPHSAGRAFRVTVAALWVGLL